MIYKDQQNNLHVLDSTEFEHLLPAGCVQITDEEVQAITYAALALTPPAPIPSISPRQIRQALTRAGLREAVESAVANGDQDLKDWWFHSNPFERLNPEVVGMGLALGQSDEQLDALWALGAML